MKILLGRTALKTLDPMALLVELYFYCRNIQDAWKYAGNYWIWSVDSPCWRDVATASILTPCWILDRLESIFYRLEVVSKETNTYVHMYIEEFILVEIWIHCCTKLNWITLEECWFIYTRNKGLRNVRIALRSQLTSED